MLDSAFPPSQALPLGQEKGATETPLVLECLLQTPTVLEWDLLKTHMDLECLPVGNSPCLGLGGSDTQLQLCELALVGYNSS